MKVQRKFIALVFIIFQLIDASAQKTEHFQDFDFWIGSWKVYKTDTDSLVGYSKISSILSGYAIKENYEAANSNYKGTGLNKYNPDLNQWEQFWVDNSGLTLHLIGALDGNKMTLQGTGKDSLQTINKISWQKLPSGYIRQIWQKSSDEGQTWQLLFDGEYRMREY